MSYHVRMNVSRDDTGWGVDIWINGAFHDRVPADNEDEAKRMLVALVDMTIEESADWRGGPLGRKN